MRAGSVWNSGSVVGQVSQRGAVHLRHPPSYKGAAKRKAALRAVNWCFWGCPRSCWKDVQGVPQLRWTGQR